MNTKLILGSVLVLGLYGVMPSAASACNEVQKSVDSARNSITIIDRDCAKPRFPAPKETGSQAEQRAPDSPTPGPSFLVAIIDIIFGRAPAYIAGAATAIEETARRDRPVSETKNHTDDGLFCLVSVAGAGDMKNIEVTLASNHAIQSTGLAVIEARGRNRARFSQSVDLDLKAGHSLTVQMAKSNTTKGAKVAGTFHIDGQTIDCE